MIDWIEAYKTSIHHLHMANRARLQAQAQNHNTPHHQSE